MEPLLLLVHRIPFPPNKGDKVRSYHLLRHLAARYRVFLGTFVDDPADAVHIDALKQWCEGVHAVRLHPWVARLRSARAFFSGEAVSVCYYRDRGLAKWVDSVLLLHGIKKVVVFSSAMAQYVSARTALQRVVDFVDVDSAKWREYALRKRGLAAAFYGREARCLLDFEQRVASEVEASFFVTAAEADLFLRQAAPRAGRISWFGNGVDSQFFSPERQFASPFASGETAIVFTGAMDYWPNADAVAWFANDSLPAIRAERPDAKFYIVGRNPGSAVRALQSDSVIVTGAVADVRPYLAHAQVVVAPMRIARGVQNKVLEAMAMGKVVVVSAAAAAGISAKPNVEVEIASDAPGFTHAVLALLGSARALTMGQAARKRILASYDWDANLRPVTQILDGSPTKGRSSAVRAHGDPAPVGSIVRQA